MMIDYYSTRFFQGVRGVSVKVGPICAEAALRRVVTKRVPHMLRGSVMVSPNMMSNTSFCVQLSISWLHLPKEDHLHSSTHVFLYCFIILFHLKKKRLIFFLNTTLSAGLLQFEMSLVRRNLSGVTVTLSLGMMNYCDWTTFLLRLLIINSWYIREKNKKYSANTINHRNHVVWRSHLKFFCWASTQSREWSLHPEVYCPSLLKLMQKIRVQ